MLKTHGRLLAILALALGMTFATKVALAEDDPPPDRICCTDGTPCSPGQACCRRKNVVVCTEKVKMECVSAIGDCEPDEENQ